MIETLTVQIYSMGDYDEIFTSTELSNTNLLFPNRSSLSTSLNFLINNRS